MLLPHTPDGASASKVATLSIIKALEFSSQTLRSGAVVLSSQEPPGSALLFLRGAPAVIQTLVDAASVPEDFEQVCPMTISMGLFHQKQAVPLFDRGSDVGLCWACNEVYDVGQKGGVTSTQLTRPWVPDCLWVRNGVHWGRVCTATCRLEPGCEGSGPAYSAGHAVRVALCDLHDHNDIGHGTYSALKMTALHLLRQCLPLYNQMPTRSCKPGCFSNPVRTLVQVVDEFSSKSFRLLAVAAGVIPEVHSLDLQRMTQQQVEAAAVSLQLLGLVVLTNSIREDSKDAIHQVQDE